MFFRSVFCRHRSCPSNVMSSLPLFNCCHISQHWSLDCLMELVLRFLHCRAWNNFAAGPRQVDRLNLFWLGHNPFLAGQTFITSYLYKMKFSTRSVNNRTKCLVIQGFDPTKHTTERTFQALLIEKTKCTSYLKIPGGLLTSLVVAITFGRHR